MDRRSFLTSLARPISSARPFAGARPLASGLEPYVPSGTDPWDLTKAAHLLRRTMFMPLWPDVQQLLPMGPSAAVDLLLDAGSTPPAFASADSQTESLDGLDLLSQNAVRGKWAADGAALRTWAAKTMEDEPMGIQEKLTFFWSGHFTSQFQADMDYVIAPLLYRQNQMFRRQGRKNFKDLAMGVTLDSAMLVYLGGALNNVGKPNENYARELLELFTTGLGWYTEGDVKEGARILTGWKVSQYSDQPQPNGIFNPYFDPPSHDVGAKQYLGVTFSARDSSTNTDFFVRRDEVRKLIDTIFEVRAEAAAKFIAQKIYRFFVYSAPGEEDQSVISAMADLFKSNWEIKPVLSALLKSAHFYDKLNIGAQIKTPADLMVGLARQLGASISIASSMTKTSQTLFNPPNVSGWPGWHDWITTSTYPDRSSIAQAAVTAMTDPQIEAFYKQFSDYREAKGLMRQITTLLLPRPLSDSRINALVTKMMGGSPDYEWPNIINASPSTAARNIRTVLGTIVALPDFQLC